MKQLFLALVLALVSFTAHAKIDRFAEVEPGIYRGAQPEVASDYEILRKLGVKTILNLRSDSTVDKERTIAESMGFTFINIPIDGFFGAPKESFNKAVEILSDNQPVFVHCQLGHDRTGVVVGLYRVHKDHWTPSQAYGEMLNFGYDFFLPGLDYAFLTNLKDAGYSVEDLPLNHSSQ